MNDMRTRLARIVSLVLLLALAPAPAHPCDDGCVGDCALTVADWRRTGETEIAGFDPRAVEDAGLFVARTTHDLLAARGLGTASVELFTGTDPGAPAGTLETSVARIFKAAFDRHFTMVEGAAFAIGFALDPAEPLHLATAAQARARTGADLLVTCKFAGHSVLLREYRPDRPELRMRRVERLAQVRFRVMATALAGAPDGAEPAFIDEIRGGFVVDTLFSTGTDEVETESSTFRAYENFPGIEPPDGPHERATDPLPPAP